jgi:dolichyl-phosphate beta-glucosyltransferase
MAALTAYGPATVTLSVVVPAYNEEKRLLSMLREAVEYLLIRSDRSLGFTWEVVVVDDGSTDRTTAVARQFAAEHAPPGRVLVHTLARNRGKGAAVREVGYLPHAAARLPCTRGRSRAEV